MATLSNTNNIIEQNEKNIQPIWRQELNAIYDYMIDNLNSLQLFKSNKYKLSYETNPNHSGYILRLGTPELNTLCIVEYGSVNNNIQKIRGASINFVRSTLEFSTGQFLFNIQLLCGYLYGIKHFYLENESNQPVRATKGIYKLFRPYLTNEKKELFSNSMNELINIENKINRYNKLSNNNIQYVLSKINGEMKLDIHSEFPINYLNQMKIMTQKIINDKRKNINIWNIHKLPSLLNLCATLLQVSNFNTTITTNIINKKITKKKTILTGQRLRPQTRLQTKLMVSQGKISRANKNRFSKGGKNKTRKQRK